MTRRPHLQPVMDADPAPVAPEPFCAVCDAHAWTEVERDSRSPVGSGTRLSCRMCGAHRIVTPDLITGDVLAGIEFLEPPRGGHGWPGDSRLN